MYGTGTFASQHEVSNKFRLYLKVREIKGIQKVLAEVEQLSLEAREAWIEEYGDLINDAIDAFVEDSGLSFDNVFSDDEALALSQELIVTLKDAIQTVEGIMYQEVQLES